MRFIFNIRPPQVGQKACYYKWFFLLAIFLSACSARTEMPVDLESQAMAAKEKEKIEAFIEEFLFQEGGCYTLFGDKPITSMLIFRGKPEDSYLENLSPLALNTLNLIDYKTAENFEAWKKLAQNLHLQNFFFVEFALTEDPSSSALYFVNIQETKKLFYQYLDLFRVKTGMHEWEPLFVELRKPNIPLWKSLFADQFLAGLLYGFGRENAETFCLEKARIFSVTFEGLATKEHFPVPVYAISDSDATVKKYKEQRENIKRLYRSKNSLEVTLHALQRG